MINLSKLQSISIPRMLPAFLTAPSVTQIHTTELVPMRDGEEITVCTIGAGDQKVFLVHGVGGSHYAWLPFAVPFFKDFTFIIPNLRGFGLSSEVPYSGDNVVENYANDLEDLVSYYIDDEEEEKFILCSLSLGALSSLCFLSREDNRSRVKSYLNVDQAPQAKNSKGWKHGLFGLNQQELLERTQALIKETEELGHADLNGMTKEFRKEYISTLAYFFANAFHRPAEKSFINFVMNLDIAPVQLMFSTSNLNSYLQCINTFNQFENDFKAHLKDFTFPVTVFSGKYSEMYPVRGQTYMVNSLPNGSHVIFDESHALMYTAPIKFLREFKKFLYEEAT